MRAAAILIAALAALAWVKLGPAAAQSDDLAATIAADRAAALGGGYVYKTPAYWARYPDRYIRAVFDGASRFQPRSPHLRTMYYLYVRTFAINCAAHVGEGAVPFEETRTVYGSFGVSSRTLASYRVPRKFAAMLQAYANQESGATSADAVAAIGGLLRGTGTGAALSDIRDRQALEESIERFFATEACASAAMYQLGENILRLAEGRASIQAGGVRVRNARAETEMADTLGAQATLFDVCMQYKGYEVRSYGNCRCLDEQVTPLLSPEERGALLQNFQLFYDEQAATQRRIDAGERSDGSPPFRRYYADQRCRR